MPSPSWDDIEQDSGLSLNSGDKPRIVIYPKNKSDVNSNNSGPSWDDIEQDNPVSTTGSSFTGNEWWQKPATEPGLLGIGERFGVGALRGAKTVLDTGAHGLQNATVAIANKILPDNLASFIQQNAEQSQAEDVAGRNAFNATYNNSTAANLGQVAGSVAATVPIMPELGIADVATGALPTVAANGAKVAAPFVNRALSGMIKGGVGGGVYGAATSSDNDKSVAQNVLENSITGALAGPLLEGVGDAAKGLGGAVVGKIGATRAQLASRAADLGIPLTATQVSNSPILKKFDQISGMLPFSGAQGISDNQISAFTRAISHTFGEDSDQLTPSFLETARQKIGNTIGNIGRNSTIKADGQLGNDIMQVINDAKGTMTEAELKPIATNIQNILDKIDTNGNISGEAYQGLTKYDGVLSKAQKSTNPNIKNAANQIRNALDNALTRSVSPNTKTALLKARQQYKSLMTVKDLAAADEEGTVSPLRLMQKVMKSPGGKLRSGELGEIADIGRAFFKQPSDSGTPLGEAVMKFVAPVLHNPISAAGAGVGSLLYGLSVPHIAEGALGLGINRGVRSAINSSPVKRAIINKGLGGTYGTINKMSNVLLPYSSAVTPKQQLPIWREDKK